MCYVASEEIRLDGWGLDVVLTVSQKDWAHHQVLVCHRQRRRNTGRKTLVTSYYASWCMFDQFPSANSNVVTPTRPRSQSLKPPSHSNHSPSKIIHRHVSKRLDLLSPAPQTTCKTGDINTTSSSLDLDLRCPCLITTTHILHSSFELSATRSASGWTCSTQCHTSTTLS